jgi:hypothetical protein
MRVNNNNSSSLRRRQVYTDIINDILCVEYYISNTAAKNINPYQLLQRWSCSVIIGTKVIRKFIFKIRQLRNAAKK